MLQIEIQNNIGLGHWEIYETESFKFSGGEIQAVLPKHLPTDLSNAVVTARLQSSDDIIHLLLITSVLQTEFTGKPSLVIPYFPYARQDRKMVDCEAFSLKAVTSLLGPSLAFYDRVTILDPHSDVTPALLHPVRVVDQTSVILHFGQLATLLNSPTTLLVSPDAGAYKKTVKTATVFNRDVVVATKVRNVMTGEITHTTVDNHEAVYGKDCLILDDICDGGRTFIELAKVLKGWGATSVSLYVTHGIFSKGLSPLYDNEIDEIYTTNSFLSDPVNSPSSPVNVLDLSCTSLLY